MGLKAQRNAPIKQVFLLNAGTKMKFYYNIQSVEEKAEEKVKIFFCGGGKILTMATEFLITRAGTFNFNTFYTDVHFFFDNMVYSGRSLLEKLIYIFLIFKTLKSLKCDTSCDLLQTTSNTDKNSLTQVEIDI